MSNDDAVIYARRQGVAFLTLNRPATRNTMSGSDLQDALVHALDQLAGDDSVRVAVLTGAGTAFSAGGDLNAMLANLDRTPEEKALATQGIQRVARAFMRVEIPVIAAINGPAIGAGLDLACMADLRIAARKASFAMSFVKVGLVPGTGGAWLLPRVVGFAKAMELALTGNPIDAEAAQACGLVMNVVEDDALAVETEALARKLASYPAEALTMTKSLLRKSFDAGFDDMLQMTAEAQAVAHASPGHRAAVKVAVAAMGDRRAAKASAPPSGKAR